mmetsp:Transcript_14680/g.31960  ORF Transcript_14680/g.31960 Transcript_14680/m.31960 type:complete len:87 (-) Transcript_14680:125-385(-)
MSCLPCGLNETEMTLLAWAWTHVVNDYVCAQLVMTSVTDVYERLLEEQDELVGRCGLGSGSGRAAVPHAMVRADQHEWLWTTQLMN